MLRADLPKSAYILSATDACFAGDTAAHKAEQVKSTR